MIDVALENVLLEILAIRAEVASDDFSKRSFKFTLLSDLMDRPIKSRARSIIDDLADKNKCRERMALVTLYWLGELLSKRGGSELMEKVSCDVAARHPAREGTLLDICSKRWDGIGDWHA